MEELSQSSPSSDMSEGDIKAALDAGVARDVNTLRALAVIQINNLNNAFANVSTILGVLSPEKQAECNTNATFAMTEVIHLVDAAFGNEREYPSTQPKEEKQ